jgi:hypothetical protein
MSLAALGIPLEPGRPVPAGAQLGSKPDVIG